MSCEKIVRPVFISYSVCHAGIAKEYRECIQIDFDHLRM